MRSAHPPGRARRAHESGVTLIELLVTIAIMAIAFVALLSGFAVVELQVRSTGADAQLASLARLVQTVVEAEPTQSGLSYVLCSPAGGASYQSQINSNSAITAAKGTNSVVIRAVAQASTASGSPVPSAISSCGGSVGPDYGVQQITFRVTSRQNDSITRIVYKRWN